MLLEVNGTAWQHALRPDSVAVSGNALTVWQQASQTPSSKHGANAVLGEMRDSWSMAACSVEWKGTLSNIEWT